MPFQIIRNDITKVKADAIVNTANPRPTYAAGTDAAIYKAAGEKQLLAERKKIGDIMPGETAVTPAFSLDAKYIIHTVGPLWEDGAHGEFDILESCYRNCLQKAVELKCESIAFPLIASGNYGFPKDEALGIALREITGFLMKSGSDMRVDLVVFDDTAFRISRSLFMEIASFIDDDGVIESYKREYGIGDGEYYDTQARMKREAEMNLLRGMKNQSSAHKPAKPVIPEKEDGEPDYAAVFKHKKNDDRRFGDALFDILKGKDIDNNKAYAMSNIDRRTFSKLINGERLPKKSTVFAFCIGLDLTREEAEKLLASAGYTFVPDNSWDRLVMHFMDTGNKDFGVINTAMKVCGHPQLGLENPE